MSSDDQAEPDCDASAIQADWLALCAGLRRQIGMLLAQHPMGPDQLHSLSVAMQYGFWVEKQALTLEHDASNKLNRGPFGETE